MLEREKIKLNYKIGNQTYIYIYIYIVRKQQGGECNKNTGVATTFD